MLLASSTKLLLGLKLCHYLTLFTVTLSTHFFASDYEPYTGIPHTAELQLIVHQIVFVLPSPEGTHDCTVRLRTGPASSIQPLIEF